jgi:cytochrome c-type biogenesis protein CcmH
MVDSMAWKARWSLVAAALLLILSWWACDAARAGEAAPVVEDTTTEARMMAIASELRCLVCQNQTVADSHAGLAIDLRREIRDLIKQGKSDLEIRDYMTARYGDFILYRPRVTSSTALLWFGPAFLMVGGLVALLVVLRRRARMAASAFDPDLPDSVES